MNADLNLEVISVCYTCFKCVGACPVGLRPITFVKAYLGFRFKDLRTIYEETIRDPSIWYCTRCLKCSEICPQKVPLHEIIEYLQHEAARNNVMPQAYLNMIGNVLKTYLAFPSQVIITRGGDIYTVDDIINLYSLSRIPKIEGLERFREKIKELTNVG